MLENLLFLQRFVDTYFYTIIQLVYSAFSNLFCSFHRNRKWQAPTRFLGL